LRGCGGGFHRPVLYCLRVSPHNLLHEYPQYFLQWQEVFPIDKCISLIISVFIYFFVLPHTISQFDKQTADHRYLAGAQPRLAQTKYSILF